MGKVTKIDRIEIGCKVVEVKLPCVKNEFFSPVKSRSFDG